jgi:rhamnose utilization protein RhaD (predicted bifunctional aldolase and dehydrogenase)/NAD(P)-dependent dehydrogenase (short-subunit alcohol dehydrogenase family)
MINNIWVESEANEYIKKYGSQHGPELALMVYATRLVGGQPDLAMHGGGNTSLKGTVKTITGDELSALFVKASGVAMDAIEPSGFVCLDHAYLKKLRTVASLTDEVMAGEFRTHTLGPGDALPSIETLMHAFLDKHFVVHTHPTSVLGLTNRENGEAAVQDALGSDVAVIPYANAGLALGRAVADKLDKHEGNRALVVMHHGLVTWGTHPKQAYDTTIEMVNRAEEYVQKSRRRVIVPGAAVPVAEAKKRYERIAPVLRGLLSPHTEDPDNPISSMVLSPVITEEILGILGSAQAQELSCSAPLTPDYLVRTKAYSLFVGAPAFDDAAALKAQLAKSITSFSAGYDAYVKKYSSRIPGLETAGFDLLPRVVMLPGIGAVCAGPDIEKARIAADITEQALVVKRAVYETGGTYRGLTEDHLFDMEFRAFQRAKVGERAEGGGPLRGKVALVTGAAGAIGSGICDELLANGCAVALTDLPGDHLDSFVKAMTDVYGNRALGVPLDVTDPGSVASAFRKTVETFGGLDIVVVNAGLAHVSPLVDLDIEAFRKLERVNVEGTLLLLAEAGRLFRTQDLGGDIVLVSTKNVFAPGAKFGAYSATKAGSHQLARIASLEFADMGVRVNMVSPDAVFSHGSTKSGLWAKVGPDRMKARGLDEKGLEEYYRSRNLLKARVTAKHVANAVLFFVTHQTPTTGATIPVDGGLPDATPR